MAPQSGKGVVIEVVTRGGIFPSWGHSVESFAPGRAADLLTAARRSNGGATTPTPGPLR